MKAFFPIILMFVFTVVVKSEEDDIDVDVLNETQQQMMIEQSFKKVGNSCFYESSQFFGRFPSQAEYVTDLNILQPDSFTKT